MEPLLITTNLLIFAGAIISVIAIAILSRLYFLSRSKQAVKKYQGEIARSHSRILKLEVTNEQLQHRINELESIINRPKIA